MTRRLAIVIVGVVLATLLLVGAGTVVLANVRARHTTEADLREQAADVATGLEQYLDIEQPLDTAAGQAALRRRIRQITAFANALRLDGIAVVVVGPRGQSVGDELPDGITLDESEVAAVAAGEVLSGNSGDTVYAISGSSLPRLGTVVVVLTRSANAGLGTSVRLFVLASVATLALAIGAALLLGGRLTRPVRESSAVAHRLAAGDLTARLPDPPESHRDELADLARSINGMAANLERSRVLEQQFLLSVSHDLRTPLTSIRGYAEAITDGAGDPHHAAGVITAEARRLERLVADLLDLAKLQSKAFTLQLAPTDLAAAARTAAEGMAHEAAERDIAITVVTPVPAVVSADADRLTQVLANLIENAVRYAATTVAVSVQHDGGAAVVSIDDDGPGIDPRDLPHVFERLYRSSAQPERRESTSGLGLAIVRELAEAMGGTVAAGTAPGGGARLAVRLPLVG